MYTHVMIAMLFSASIIHSLAADTITVCDSGCDFTTIYDAIGSAQEGDVVEIDAGIYRLWNFTGNDDVDWAPGQSPYQGNFIISGITIRGSVDSNGKPSTFVYYAPVHCNTTDDTQFENIQFGINSQLGKSFNMLIEASASPSFTNCVFLNSDAAYRFGDSSIEAVVQISGAHPSFTDCEFISIGGVSDDTSGSTAIYIRDTPPPSDPQTPPGNAGDPSDPTFTHCRFVNCISSANGVIACRSKGTFLNCSFENNNASGPIGKTVLYVKNNRELLVKECSFIGNQSSQGAAIYLSSSSNDVTIESCHFSKNFSQERGGAIFSNGASPELINCTFTGNFANIAGGAIHCVSSGLNLTNCEFSSNFPDSIAGPFSTTPPTILQGDVNHDGVVDRLDVLALKEMIGICNSDLDGDGAVNGIDLSYVLTEWSAPCEP